MDLIFQPQRGTNFSIEIGFFDTIQEIKEKIQKEQGIPASNQTLIFKGNVLMDDLNVHYSDILDQSQIQLLVATDKQHNVGAAVSAAANGGNAEEESPMSPPPPPAPPDRKPIQIFLKIAGKSNVSIEIDTAESVRRLKERIQEMEGIPTGKISVYAKGAELLDNRTLRDYELSDQSEVDVSIKHSLPPPLPPQPPQMTTSSGSSGNTTNGSKKLRIMVLSKCGTKKFPVEMNPTDNVGELRRELQRLKVQLPHEGYFFIYNQNVMDDDLSFRWHNVGQGDTIEIFNGSVTGGA